MDIEPVDLHFKRYDGGTGTPLVILHGLLGSGGNWHTLSRNAFSEHRTVYTVDLRNHGRSPHARRFDYPAMVADLVYFFDRNGLDEACVLGHSMGGKVAMELALRHADLVSKLILIDIAPRSYPPRHAPIFEALRSVDFAFVSERSDVDEQLARTIASRPVRQFLMKNLSYDPDTGVYGWQMALDVIYDNYEQINVGIENGRTYDGPTLVVRGGSSDYITDEDEGLLESLFPRVSVETIEGAGHWVHADRPDALADVVESFLRKET